MTIYYTGIGSRATTPEMLSVMRQLGEGLAKWGYTLRSGAAGGADAAFEAGCDAARGAKQIYLPWPKFNGHPSHLHTVGEKALALAAEMHPAWERCSQGAKRLHARNGYQVLGGDLSTPSDFVVCYTTNGQGGGGTGQAIRIARKYGIPVFDLGGDFHRVSDELGSFVESLNDAAA